MSTPGSLQSVERATYRRAYSDGIIDLYLGLSLLWIGGVWLWVEDWAGLAGILPAALSPVAITFRKEFVEKRVGYVRWSEQRRLRERRGLIASVGFGALILTIAVGLYLIGVSSPGEPVLDLVAPGLISWLLALLVVAIALLLESWRFVAYAVVLAVAGLVTAILDANPGWPMLAGGVASVAIGTMLLVVFTRANPVKQPE